MQTPNPGGRLTIGELARIAGVSTRAVRHYHSIGLLPEPRRDHSGYRRYDGRDVVALVRVARLRALGMPLPQIAERLADEVGEQPLAEALHSLADEVDGEIAQLSATRDRLRALAGSETFDQPVKALTDALHEHGLLGPSDELVAGEVWAAALLDALHPQGMDGVLDEAARLFTDPATVERLGTLRQRFRRLDDRAPDAEIDALAEEVASVLATAGDAPALDFDVLDTLLTARLNRSKRRVIDSLHERVVAAR